MMLQGQEAVVAQDKLEHSEVLALGKGVLGVGSCLPGLLPKDPR